MEAAACSPAAAVPVRPKIPVPIIAPIPSAVRSSALRERFNWRSGACASRINSSGLLVRKSVPIQLLRRHLGCKPAASSTS